jgi:hypothetical protein
MSDSYCPPNRLSDWMEPDPGLGWREATTRRKKTAHPKYLIVGELVSKAMAADVAASESSAALEQRFRELSENWERETGSLSSLSKRVMNRNYQAIVGMGEQVVPILLRDLRDNRRDWFWALSAITRENPIDRADAGRVDRMIAAWIDWGKKKRML